MNQRNLFFSRPVRHHHAKINYNCECDTNRESYFAKKNSYHSYRAIIWQHISEVNLITLFMTLAKKIYGNVFMFWACYGCQEVSTAGWAEKFPHEWRYTAAADDDEEALSGSISWLFLSPPPPFENRLQNVSISFTFQPISIQSVNYLRMVMALYCSSDAACHNRKVWDFCFHFFPFSRLSRNNIYFLNFGFHCKLKWVFFIFWLL